MSWSISALVRTFARDVHVFPLMLASIERFFPSMAEVVVQTPPKDAALFRMLARHSAMRIVHVDGCVSSRFGDVFDDILRADLHTQSTFVMHLDADMVLVRPMTVRDLVVDGRPIMRAVARSALEEGAFAANEPSMRLAVRHPKHVVLGRQVFHRDTYATLRARLRSQDYHGRHLDIYSPLTAHAFYTEAYPAIVHYKGRSVCRDRNGTVPCTPLFTLPIYYQGNGKDTSLDAFALHSCIAGANFSAYLYDANRVRRHCLGRAVDANAA